jgi:hypothetical protein
VLREINRRRYMAKLNETQYKLLLTGIEKIQTIQPRIYENDARSYADFAVFASYGK